MTDRHHPTVVHTLHSLDGGGTERALVSILRSIDRGAARHAVVTLREAGPLAEGLPDDVTCHSLRARGGARFAGLRLGAAVRRLGGQIIHARNTGSWFDATIAKLVCPWAKLVLGFHGLESASPFTWRHRWKARLALRLGARFTTVGRSGASKLHRQLSVPSRRITVLPNGVNLESFERFSPDDRIRTRHDLDLSETDLVIGTVGSLTPVKDHAGLLRSFASIVSSKVQWKLLIVGDGPLRGQLVELSEKLGLRQVVRFAGRREDIPDVLGSIDLYVCSSLSEGMSNAVLEAMAAGLPIVATNVGDNTRLLRDGYEARIVPPGDPEQLAVALRAVGSSFRLRQRFGRAARQQACKYDIRKTAAVYERYYRTLLEKGQASADAQSRASAKTADGAPFQSRREADDTTLADVLVEA